MPSSLPSQRRAVALAHTPDIPALVHAQSGQQDLSSRTIFPLLCVSLNWLHSPCLPQFPPCEQQAHRLQNSILMPNSALTTQLADQFFKHVKKPGHYNLPLSVAKCSGLQQLAWKKSHFSCREFEHRHVVPALSCDTGIIVSLSREERQGKR